MIRLAIAYALLAACSAAGADPAPTYTVDPGVWVDASSPLYDVQGAWGLPMPFEPALVYDFGTQQEVSAACGRPDEYAFACTQFSAKRIILATDIPEGMLTMVLEHEVGHVISGRWDHLHGDDCPVASPGAHTMCAFGRTSPLITGEDFGYVLRLDE